MTWWELDNILTELNEDYKVEANNIRLLMYSVFQSQSSKKLKLTDVMKFEWEKETVIEVDESKLVSLTDAKNIINRIKK